MGHTYSEWVTTHPFLSPTGQRGQERHPYCQRQPRARPRTAEVKATARHAFLSPLGSRSRSVRSGSCSAACADLEEKKNPALLQWAAGRTSVRRSGRGGLRGSSGGLQRVSGPQMLPLPAGCVGWISSSRHGLLRPRDANVRARRRGSGWLAGGGDPEELGRDREDMTTARMIRFGLRREK